MSTRLLSALLCCFFFLPPLSAGETEAEETQFQVTLTVRQQRLADIRTRPPETVGFTPDEPFPARIVDPLPLLEMAERLRKLRAQEETARHFLAIAGKTHDRLRQLESQVRQESLLEAEKNWLAARLRAQTLAFELKQSRLRLRFQWGEVLAKWAEDPGAPLKPLAEGRKQLLQVVVPLGHPHACEHAVRLLRPHLPPLSLRCLSAAPRADARYPGRAFFYLADAGNLPSGTSLTVWETSAGPALPLPADAVVWHRGKPWIYLRTGGETFQRLALSHYRPGADTWWITSPIPEGGEIVVRGAQILLSAEFRGQVPEEDDDDD